MQQQYVTKQMLLDLGIQLADEDIESLLTHLNDKIEEVIGAEITQSLNDAELEELIVLQDSGSEDDIANWIMEHVPDYKEIVEDNIELVLGEMVDNAGKINRAAAVAVA